MAGTTKSQYVVDGSGLVNNDPVTQLTATIQGLYGQKAFIATEYEYDTKTCLLISDGVWTAPSAPKYGAVSSAMVEAPIEVDGNPGNCNGTMIEQNYVYDTLASGHQTVATDNFVVDWAFSQGDDPEVQYTVTANRGPRLLAYVNNTFIDVTGQTSTVAIGQDTGAVADYYDYIATGTTLSSTSYTANGTRVQSYTPSATACNSSVPCPMILPNSYAGATPYAYTASGSYSQSWNFTTSDGGSGSVSTNFNAVGPTDANVQTTTNAVMLLTQGGSPFLQMGNYNADLYGITFLGSANDPPGYTGTLTWVQVVRMLSYTNIVIAHPGLVIGSGARASLTA